MEATNEVRHTWMKQYLKLAEEHAMNLAWKYKFSGEFTIRSLEAHDTSNS